MIDAGRRGSIITIASIAAKLPEAGRPSYAVSKAGVWMLTKQAARSLAPAGIRVNAIGPGYIDTNMTAIIHEIPDAEERLVAKVPMGRMGTPREIATAALFLASATSPPTSPARFSTPTAATTPSSNGIRRRPVPGKLSAIWREMPRCRLVGGCTGASLASEYEPDQTGREPPQKVGLARGVGIGQNSNCLDHGVWANGRDE